ncbi:MAG: Glucosyl-3-phosphoglycerate/mannosyl-3-phosphoglycerate phosphatase [Candidatus Celerinatantimonas neptuna]|nr:MAG: Glucosyl-3-phosphoglycerate/mannosyl-3-phosphoglycerate phosphatase [Candidatus Celerinatantimonas neptuna]
MASPNNALYQQTTNRVRLSAPSKHKTSLLVFSDLDGTLLDHDNYSFEAAKPALLQLFRYNIPLLLNTSKTFSETVEIQHQIGGYHPFVTENGAAIAIPENYFYKLPEHDDIIESACRKRYFIKHFGHSYAFICDYLSKIRASGKYTFRGFHDMSTQEVAKITGLSLSQAKLSRQRLASEPLIWESGDLEAFREQLELKNLILIQGGRFWHVKSASDKAQAMHWLTDLYQQQYPNQHFLTVALGDSPNDLTMLNQADIAIAIRSHNGHHRLALNSNRPNRIYTQRIGPAGWQAALLRVIEHYPPKERYYG